MSIIKLERQMVGLKNITIEKMQIVLYKFQKICTKYEKYDTIDFIELYMNIIKYLWKCVLRNFMDFSEFKTRKNLVFEQICNQPCLPEYLQVQIDEFVNDINELFFS